LRLCVDDGNNFNLSELVSKCYERTMMTSGFSNFPFTLWIALWLLVHRRIDLVEATATTLIEPAPVYVAQAAAAEKLGECLPSSTDETQFHCFAGLRTITTAATNDIADEDINYYAEDCFDLEVNECPGWAATGECTINPDYMLHHCRYSCQTCMEIDGHGGTTQIAPAHAKSAVVEHLKTTAQYIRTIIETQPQLRATCRNHNSECTFWAVQGECLEGDKIAPYMLEHCPAACRACV
jgi:ShK domain-like